MIGTDLIVSLWDDFGYFDRFGWTISDGDIGTSSIYSVWDNFVKTLGQLRFIFPGTISNRVNETDSIYSIWDDSRYWDIL